eukprot:CAMPEP_0194189846 /NCGR_PEP_ID=MMETSP0154-20130528/60559_1 /TAXON_ID=1049557 /ORGANISM="Thalassiothrix antarctica, Strain L6-D1" /LENGTH=477 /DNA_ID=CAMNT_0038911301 /DNA_START=97 /DNA_END=1530 /DNA_ORIENTATION=-
MARKGYEQLVHAIIRPPRALYDPNIATLGPIEFLFLGKKFCREDVELESRNNPHFNPNNHEEEEEQQLNNTKKNTDQHILNNYSHKKKLNLKASIWTRQDDVNAREEGMFNNKNNRRTMVLYLHGNASARVEVVPHLSFLLSLGIFGVCSMDFTGSGLSDGDYVSLGYYERYDLECVLQYLQTRYPNLEIVLWGRSMGASTALMHASEKTRNILSMNQTVEQIQKEQLLHIATNDDNTEEESEEPPTTQSLDRGGGVVDPDSSNVILKGLILDSPFASLIQLCEELVEKARAQGAILPSLLISVALTLISRSIHNQAHFPLREISPIDHVSSSSTPALFIVGADDNFIPPHHSEDLVERYRRGVSTNLFMVPGGHNDVRPPVVMEAIHQFLQVRLSLSSSDALKVPDYLAKSNLIHRLPPWKFTSFKGVFTELERSSIMRNNTEEVQEELGMTQERQDDIQNKLHLLSMGQEQQQAD